MRVMFAAGEPADSIDDHGIPCYPKKTHPLRSLALIMAVGSRVPEAAVQRRG
jgi:hypothetical protein